MKQLFSAELKENVTRDFFKKYLRDETDEKSIFYRYVVYMLYILSIKIFFHICVSKFKINKRQTTGSIQLILRPSYIIIQSSFSPNIFRVTDLDIYSKWKLNITVICIQFLIRRLFLLDILYVLTDAVTRGVL